MLQSDPADQTLRYMLAMELSNCGETDRSLILFEGLMNDPEPYVPAFLMCGQLQTRLDQPENARQTFLSGIAEAKRQKNDHAAGEMAQFLASLPS